MRNFKKVLTLCSALLLALGLAGACATPETGSPENSESQSVSAPESSVPETDENSGASTPEEPVEPEEPEEPALPTVHYEEVGYFTKTLLPCEFVEVSHELDAGIYFVTSYEEHTVFDDTAENYYGELTESGALTFNVFYNDASNLESEVETDYYIYKIIPVEMDAAECKANLLADGAITPVSFTVAEAGAYSFSVNQEVSFYSGVTAEKWIGTKSAYTLLTDKANTEITLYIGGLESAYDGVELTFRLEKLSPTAVTEATETLNLTVAGDNAYSFTAAENGAYRIDFDENLSVATFDSKTNDIAYSYDSSYLEFDYTGSPVVFFAKYAYPDEFVSPYAASVTITRVGDVGYRSPVAPDDIYLNFAGSVSGTVPANSVAQEIPLTVIVSAVGDWSISWDNDKVKVYVGETLIEKGHTFTVENRYSSLTLTVHNETDSDQSVTFTVTKSESVESSTALKLGANAITVTVTNYFPDQTVCTFTAEKAGKYRLSKAEDEDNADIYYNNELIEDYPYEFELEANGDISFAVTSIECMTLTEDVLDIVIEYYDETTQTWVQA